MISRTYNDFNNLPTLTLTTFLCVFLGRHSSSERNSGTNLIRVGSLKHAAIEAEQKRLDDAEKEAAKMTRSASAKKVEKYFFLR